jgi:uncharacterized protein (DUF1015 family)
MTYFVESSDRMLTILPTHRVIKDSGGLGMEDLLERLGRSFRIEAVRGIAALQERLDLHRGSFSFGLYMSGRFYILKLKDSAAPSRMLKDKPKDWRKLDVAILHHFVLERLLDIRDDERNIGYVKDPEEAVRLVDSRSYKAAIFLNPTKVSQVKRIAKAGEKMPRKATYFYPKPLSGLVMNRIT